MGGYSSSYVREKTPQEKCNESLGDFFRTKKKEDLLKAYEHINRAGDSLISTLLGSQNKELVKEFPDYEIEYKANITLAISSKLFSKARELTKRDLQEIHQAIKFDRDKTNYLNDTKEPQISVGQNHFYSTKDEERFVLSCKNDKWSTKIKEFVSHYSFGLKYEEFVMKRKESLGSVNLVDLVNMILDISKTQEIVYEGFMEKTKADQFLLNIKTGRVYNFTIGLCKSKGREDLTQLEIEYAGYVPTQGFDRKANSEKDIVKEILEIQEYVLNNYNDYKLNDNILTFTPTTLTKFEWITGKIISSEAKNKGTPLVEEQTFFEDTV